MVAFLPAPLVSALSRSSAVGFSGSRSAALVPAVALSVFQSVPVSSRVFVGCALGLDSAARAVFPHAVVYRASSFGVGRGAFAARSVALVRGLSSCPAPVFVSFPGAACPQGLVPSASSSACFCGLGSGSWASLAFAVGLGIPCFVWLPPGVSFPSSWSAVWLGGGWWAPVV